MALIFRVSSEQNAPIWYKEATSILPIDSNNIAEEEVIRIASFPKDIDDEALSNELDIIEARSKTREVYHYSSTWNKNAKNIIKEYSIATNCKSLEVNPEDECLVEFASVKKSEEILQKTASTSCLKKTIDFKDSFTLDAPFSKKDDTSAITAGLKGLEMVRSGIPATAARGVTISRASSSLDDNNAGFGIKASPGRNVIQDPNSIERSANSKTEDLGVRLRRERDQKVQAKIAQRKAEEKKIVKKMENSGYGGSCQGNFRLTEAVSIQGGVTRKSNRDFSKPTLGEKLVQARKCRENESLLKKAEAKKQWNHIQGASKPKISDDLANALKAELSKIA